MSLFRVICSDMRGFEYVNIIAQPTAEEAVIEAFRVDPWCDGAEPPIEIDPEGPCSQCVRLVCDFDADAAECSETRCL